uniref:glycine betaine ABC transporter substrate-binding protein n=1 Tax=Bacillus sp. WP8 TaxID=756828 RepID=UPI0028CB1F83
LPLPHSLPHQYNLSNISHLPNIKNPIKPPFTLHFSHPHHPYPPIQKPYQFSFHDLLTIHPNLPYPPIPKPHINFLHAYSTHTQFTQYKLNLLHHHHHLFPPYQPPPLLTHHTLTQFPHIHTSLNKLPPQITDHQMTQINYQLNLNPNHPFHLPKPYLKNKKFLQ